MSLNRFVSNIIGDTGLTKTDTDIIDPYSKLRSQWQTYMQGRLGKTTPYADNPAFDLVQPEVEGEVERSILGRLREPKSFTEDYRKATDQYSQARKAAMEETYAKEKKDVQNMYNRLGLASSTPGLHALSDVQRKQATEANLLDSELQYLNLDRTLSAMGLEEQAYQSILGQGQQLGQAQRGYEQWGKQMSMEDLIRLMNEEYQYAALTGGILGQNAPQYIHEPSALDDIMQLVSSFYSGGSMNKPQSTTTGGGANKPVAK